MELADNPFFFVHIPKCAGTAVQKALNFEWCGDRHRTTTEIIDLVGIGVWRSKYSLAVVRNPWDRAVSWYEYHRQTHPQCAEYYPSFREWVLGGMLTHWDCQWDGQRRVWDMRSWTEYKGNVVVKDVVYYELLPICWPHIQRRAGIKAGLDVVNASRRRRDYRSYYDNETKAAVAARCTGDIEHYRYSF